MDVPLEYHPQIIGRAGETINKIRKNYDVQISLPKKNEPDNTIITITGVQQSVESAKTEIMDIVQQLVSGSPVFLISQFHYNLDYSH